MPTPLTLFSELIAPRTMNGIVLWVSFHVMALNIGEKSTFNADLLMTFDDIETKAN